MSIEAELTRRIGDTGKRVHTARSRNDQVALDFRLYLKNEIEELRVSAEPIAVLLDIADKKRQQSCRPIRIPTGSADDIRPLHDGVCQYAQEGRHTAGGLPRADG
jgi:hypothetical protein